eukprot:TRINITY_DN5188_c0_g1_i1.p1 TRINITY_DN5188_c0_g1~~TRINITY_DN5188_c0_g1_i1.p1  ORF type:complete len:236 (+),score=5.62 TRINITY_DN5188_c0_g1_i1:475-1182(+)
MLVVQTYLNEMTPREWVKSLRKPVVGQLYLKSLLEHKQSLIEEQYLTDDFFDELENPLQVSEYNITYAPEKRRIFSRTSSKVMMTPNQSDSPTIRKPLPSQFSSPKAEPAKHFDLSSIKEAPVSPSNSVANGLKVKLRLDLNRFNFVNTPTEKRLKTHESFVPTSTKTTGSKRFVFATKAKTKIPLFSSSVSHNFPKIKQFITTITVSLSILYACLLYTSPSPRDGLLSRMPSSA